MSWPDFLKAEWVSAISGIVIASVGGGWGLLTYRRKKNHEMVTSIIMPLLEKYNNLHDADIAIDILDDVPYKIRRFRDQKAFNLYCDHMITVDDLPLVLRDHRWVNTTDEEDKVRDSFDALLYFFAELDYMVKLHLIKKDELDLFRYEIRKVVNNPAVLNFVRIYKLHLCGNLDENLKSTENSVVMVGNQQIKDAYLKKLLLNGYSVDYERPPQNKSEWVCQKEEKQRWSISRLFNPRNPK